jgi:hypothetical protein
MAKKKAIPKKIAGFKVPKAVRQSKLLRNLLANPVGRQILADALIAGAGAAATTLVRDRGQVADAAAGAADATARGGRRVVGLLGEAIESAADAAFAVVTDAARALAPHEKPRGKKRDKAPAEPVHH